MFSHIPSSHSWQSSVSVSMVIIKELKLIDKATPRDRRAIGVFTPVCYRLCSGTVGVSPASRGSYNHVASAANKCTHTSVCCRAEGNFRATCGWIIVLMLAGTWFRFVGIYPGFVQPLEGGRCAPWQACLSVLGRSRVTATRSRPAYRMSHG